MTSAITTTNIDVTFPVPGADNDTSGFRTNFGAIKNALDTAQAEISDLQIINSALTSIATVAPTTSTGKAGDIIGQIYASSSSIAIAYETYVDTVTPIWNIVDTTRITKSLQWKSSAPATSTGTSGDVQGMVYATTSNVYLCVQTWSTSTNTNIWAKINCVPW
jgi:hypothetical protein